MKLEARYQGRSAIVSEPGRSQVAFATNTLREASHLEGEVGRPLVLREGLAALHAVVVSDLKYRPKDRLAFRAWLEEQDRRFLGSLGVKSQEALQRLRELEARQDALDRARLERLAPFHAARQRYIEHVWTHQYELSYLLDPVITVHPDELSFEAFSRDESSYARLAVRHDLFSRIDSFACGTTNIDYSARLHDQLERMRSYRETRFAVGPSGFAARSLAAARDVMIIARRPTSAGGFKVSGSAAAGTDGGGRVRPQLELSPSGDIVTATCTCRSFTVKKLAQGPCEHVLALRLAHMARLEEEARKQPGGA